VKNLKCGRRLAVTALAAGLAGILAGCSGTPPKASLELALVPGADVLVKADFKALSQAPLSKLASDLVGKQKSAVPWARAAERALQAMALNEEDVTAALMSLDLDTVSMSQQGWSAADYEKASLALAVQVAKPVTPAQLQAGVMAAAGNRSGVMVSDTTVAGRPVLTMRSPDPAVPAVYGAVSADGLILFATLNGAAMEALLRREQKGVVEALSPEMALAFSELAGAQVQAAVVLPESARQALREALDQPKASGEVGLLLAMGLLNPLKSLASLSAGLAFRTDLAVTLGLGFKDEANAQQAHALVQGVLMPMLQGAARPDQGGPAVEVEKALTCALKGRGVTVTVTLTEDELRSTLDKKAPAPAARRTGSKP
jgi:hypothetical protein